MRKKFTQLELDNALIGFVERVHDYYVKRQMEEKPGCFDVHQRTALTKFLESWCQLSVDGAIDPEVILELEKRGLLVDAPKVEPPAIISAHDNPLFTNVAQTTAVTCQSACICMALGWGPEQEMKVREALVSGGRVAGDPLNMAEYLESQLGSNRYKFYGNASMNEIEAWLSAGCFLIVHAYTTTFGHVYALDGLGQKGGQKLISVKDPWGEYDFLEFQYIPGTWFYDGFYSALGVFSTIMAWSIQEAQEFYQEGEIDPSLAAAYVHVIKPE